MSMTDRLTARDAALLLIDLQPRLLGTISEAPLLKANALRLAQAAGLLGIPLWATEQSPMKLGPTDPELASLIPTPLPKSTFRCGGAPGLLEALEGCGVRHVTLAGIEAHVCVAQTALELLSRGFAVQVPVDAVGSRGGLDREIALRRLEGAGAVLSTVEAVLFEWTETAEHPQFRSISALVRDFRPPGSG